VDALSGVFRTIVYAAEVKYRAQVSASGASPDQGEPMNRCHFSRLLVRKGISR
jgi:hypothetical protein